METISLIFNELLYRPLFNALVFLYNIIPGHDFGIAIIILTVVIRLLLYPLSRRSIEAQKVLQELEPKKKEIEKKYKDDKQKQMQAVMGFYREHKINPMAGCLPLLIQFPILIALYRTFMAGFDPARLSNLYAFIANPGKINPMFLGIIDLSKVSIVLAVLAGVLQFVQAKMIMPKMKKKSTEGKSVFAQAMGQQMVYFMPIFMIMIALKLPAGLPLYWIVVTLFAIYQQWRIGSLREKRKDLINQVQSCS